MDNNPFTSDTFTSTWCRHFSPGQDKYRFEAIKGLEFIPHPKLPMFVNVGKTQSKGITYRLNTDGAKSASNKLFLIYDVPSFASSELPGHTTLKRNRVKQYPGYLIQLDKFKDFSDYFNRSFKGKSRYKLRSYRKQLEASFNISYVTYYGDISKEKYEKVFRDLRVMMVKRFDDKGTLNNNLEEQEWNFYKEVFYPMVLKKEASLFVTYANDNPIGMMVNYIWGDRLICAMTVFDINYAQYNVGSVNIMKLTEWCFDNGFTSLDFSKGEFEYKKRWCNFPYHFEHHIIYDSSSIKISILAHFFTAFLNFKNWLRRKNVNEVYYKAIFYMREKGWLKSA